jgi:hypothetical protein
VKRKKRKEGIEESVLELRVERRKVFFSAAIIFYLVVTLPK